MDKLHIPPEKLSLDGKGGTAPLADNRTEAGRALNRRVEVRITSSRLVARPHLRVIKALKGAQHSSVEKDAAPLPGVTYSAGTSAAQPPSPGVGTAPNPGQQPVAASAALDAGGSAPRTDTAAPASAPSPHEPAVQATPATPPKPEGLLFPADGDLLVERTNPVRVQIVSGLQPRLVVDGREIPADRIGFKAADPATGKTTYGYIGIDFGEPGRHTILMQGLDPSATPAQPTRPP